jgi:hypothetical protein
MKINKKLIVASLSTALGLGIVGSVTGTVAWYQYSTKAITSIVGANASESGYLSISADGTNYKTDLFTKDILDNTANAESGHFSGNFEAVTFGGIAKDGAMPADSYLNPRLGHQPLNEWKPAKGVNYEYLQYDLYLKAEKYNESTDAYEVVKDLPIYLTNMEIANGTVGKNIADAVHIHIAVDGGNNYLITRTGADVATCGELDLDNDGANDPAFVYQPGSDPAHANDPVAYGTANTKNTSYSIANPSTDNNSILTLRGTDGRINPSAATTHEICKTNSTTGIVKLTVTIWLEGWAMAQLWNPTQTANAQFKIGMTFDVGRDAYLAA